MTQKSQPDQNPLDPLQNQITELAAVIITVGTALTAHLTAAQTTALRREIARSAQGLADNKPLAAAILRQLHRKLRLRPKPPHP